MRVIPPLFRIALLIRICALSCRYQLDVCAHVVAGPIVKLVIAVPVAKGWSLKKLIMITPVLAFGTIF